MPDCWIFLLKRRRALSNVSFSPTRTSANPGSPPLARVSDAGVTLGATGARRARHQPVTEPPEHSRGARVGQTNHPRARGPLTEFGMQLGKAQSTSTRAGHA